MASVGWFLIVASIHSVYSTSTCQRPSIFPPADLVSSCETFSKHQIVTLEARLQELTQEATTLREQSALCAPRENTPATFSIENRDCQDVVTYNVGPSGVYNVTTLNQTRRLHTVHRGGDTEPDDHYLVIDASGTTPVYCDIEDGVGWTVVLRRSSLQDDFNRTWAEYQDGFGDLNDDFWMGLETLHRITTQPFTSYSMWITIKDKFGVPAVFPYAQFKVLDGSTQYRLEVSGHRGRLSEQMLRSNQQTFRQWPSRPHESADRSCSDRGHVGGGYWWFDDNGSRFCGANGLTSIAPYWGGISPASNPITVEMKIKRN